MSMVDKIARVAHQVNRAYCQSIGDMSVPEWEDAPDWQRQSVRVGVLALIDDPSMTPRDSHDSWLATKLADGWVYGPVKDPELKQNPCMMPYDELPAFQKTKDHLFLAVVRNMLP